MAINYSCICEDGSSGAYWSGLSSADRLRYGAAGNERVYSGLVSAYNTRRAVAANVDTEVFEICDAFSDVISGEILFDWTNISAFSVVITTDKNYMVSGSLPNRTAGFHGGSVTGGYVLSATSSSYYTALYVRRDRIIIDGIRAYTDRTAVALFRVREGAFNRISNCIAEADAGESYGFRGAGTAGEVFNNIAYNCSNRGFYFAAYNNNYSRVYNNTAVDCNYGFYASGSPCYGTYFNNLSIGNTVNWYGEPSDPNNEGMYNNAGVSGDSPWDSGTSAITTCSTADFEDYANQDFRPTSSAAWVDAGKEVHAAYKNIDMLGNTRPSPRDTADEITDIGCFEYDFGEAPAETVSIAISGIISGSELAIYNASTGAEIVEPTTISGTSFSTTYTYTTDVTVDVKIRNASGSTKYLPLKQQGVISSSGLSMIVSQIEDTIA